MTASLTGTVIKISLLCNSKNFTVNNKSAIYLHSFKEGLLLISTHCQAFINLHKQLEQFIWWKNDFIIIWSSSNLKLQSRATRSSQVQILPFSYGFTFLKRLFSIKLSSSTIHFSIIFKRYSGESIFVVLKEPKESAGSKCRCQVQRFQVSGSRDQVS